MSLPRVAVRILILEDSDLDAVLIEDELKRSGVDYVPFRTDSRLGFEGALQTFHPNIIFADFKLPGFGGREALEIAVKVAPHVPFIIISGAVGEDVAVELLKAGATDFVLKDRLLRLVPALYRALREVEERLALERTQAELYSCNSELEQRVRDRTR